MEVFIAKVVLVWGIFGYIAACLGRRLNPEPMSHMEAVFNILGGPISIIQGLCMMGLYYIIPNFEDEAKWVL